MFQILLLSKSPQKLSTEKVLVGFSNNLKYCNQITSGFLFFNDRSIS